MEHPPKRPPFCEQDFGPRVLRQAAQLVNSVWLLARVHRRPEALRFLALLARALGAPPPHLPSPPGPSPGRGSLA